MARASASTLIYIEKNTIFQVYKLHRHREPKSGH